MRLWHPFLIASLLLVGRAEAAFDLPATWDVSGQTDFRSEFLSRYDAPWRLLQTHLSDDQLVRMLSDADGRISPEFGVPNEILPQVRLWLEVYTRYSSQEALIFDEDHPEVIYEVLDFRELARTSRNRAAFEIVSRRRIQARLAEYRAAFAELGRKHSKSNSRLSATARRILAARSRIPHTHAPREAVKTLRLQWGQRDQVMLGLQSSSGFIHRMEEIFREMGVPEELVLLSLVESSFNSGAISRAGAAGVWQFMPDSGREFMHLSRDGSIDERYSPIKSTIAAGRLLLRNRKMLGSWLLAASAYNNGHAKWVRLSSAERLRAPAILAQCSRSRTRTKLGFASRNYVAEHLALLRAYHYQELAFGGFPGGELAPIRFLRLEEGGALGRIALQQGLPESELRRLNPDIRDPSAVLPAGYWVALPALHDEFEPMIASKFRSRTKRVAAQPVFVKPIHASG